MARVLGKRPFRVIHLKSMPDVLAGQERPAFAVLVAVVSRSPSILSWAGTLLGSLGFDADCVLLRDPGEAGWQQGLAACAIVATDVVSAREFPEKARPRVFRLVSEESLAELRELVTVEEVSQAPAD